MGLDITKEIEARLGSARQAFEEMKLAIFLNKRLPVAARLQLFHSLILSRLFYGCAVWTDVPLTIMKRIDAALMTYTTAESTTLGFGTVIKSLMRISFVHTSCHLFA